MSSTNPPAGPARKVRRILRYNITAGTTPQSIAAGPIVRVAPDRHAIPGSGRLEVWVEATTTEDFPIHGVDGAQSLTVYGTGHPINDDHTHVASVVDGPFIWHVYRVPPDDEAPGAVS